MSEMGRKTHIVIADDHAVLRESLAALLETQEEFQVVGTAGDGKTALELVQRHHPEVLVLDLFMPGFDGFELLRTLDRAGSRVASIVLTASESQLDYAQAVRLGARGLVQKGDDPQKLFAAIGAVAGGELAFSEEVTQQVLHTMVGESRQSATSMQRLSAREREIAAWVARGLKNRDIAQQLSISENTVKRHLQSIFSKTGAHDRLELAVLAMGENTRAA